MGLRKTELIQTIVSPKEEKTIKMDINGNQKSDDNNGDNGSSNIDSDTNAFSKNPLL